jgi:cytochrome c biogenesis protein CcmG/thiol:disulfide interchange protein DsbE
LQGPSEHDGDHDGRRLSEVVATRLSRTSAVLLLALVAVVALALASVLATGPRVRVGEPAPPIVGTTLDGEAFDLAAYRGRPVVLNFWASWCVPCRTEFPLLIAKQAEHEAEGLKVLGVLFRDALEPARAFMADQGADWPTVRDPDGAHERAYRVVAPPQTYFVDREGIVRSIQIGELTESEFERQFGRIAG